jgi:hypothetical protein
MSKKSETYLDALRMAALEVRMTEMLMREIPPQNVEEIKKAMEFYQWKVEELHKLVRTDNLITLIRIVNALDLFFSGSSIFDEEKFTQDMTVLYKPLRQPVDIIQKGN